MIDINTLRFCPLFMGVPGNELQLLLDKISYQKVDYKPDSLIAQYNDVCDRLMIVLTGSVKAEMTDTSGKTIKIEDMGPGQPLAPAFVFGMKNKFPVNVVANTTAQLLIIYTNDLIHLMQLDARILNNYLNIICTRSQFLAEKIKFLSFRTIKEKIALYLLEKSQNETYRIIDINQSQQELADLFGVTRPSLTRALSELEDEKLIVIERKQLTIVDFKKLKQTIKT